MTILSVFSVRVIFTSGCVSLVSGNLEHSAGLVELPGKELFSLNVEYIHVNISRVRRLEASQSVDCPISMSDPQVKSTTVRFSGTVSRF